MKESLYNSIDYDVQPSLSVVRDRNFKRNYPVTQVKMETNSDGSPTRSTVINFSVNPTEFVDTWNSVLHYFVTPRATCYQGQYVFSLADFISNVTLRDRNGLEIERITSVNLLNACIVGEKWGDDYLNTTCASMGVGRFYHTKFFYIEGTDNEDEDVTEPFQTIPPNNEYPGTLQDIQWTDRFQANPVKNTDFVPRKYEVLIPLNLLFGIFATDKLLPPHFLAGLEMTIEWENAKTVLKQNVNPYQTMGANYMAQIPPLPIEAAANIYFNVLDPTVSVPGYKIEDIYLILDCYTLDNSVVSSISELYTRSSGIPLKFQTYTRVFYDQIGIEPTVLSLPIEQSFTDATKLITTIRVKGSGLIEAKSIYVEPLIPLLSEQPWFDGTQFQVRYNGISYPHDPVNTKEQAYRQWLSSFGKNRMYTDITGVGYDWFRNQMGSTFAVDLNRAPFNFRISGSALSTVSNVLTSGQRIDGTNPLTLNLTLPEVPDTFWATIATLNTLPNRFREIYGWIEHNRILLVRSDGNRILN